MSEKYTKTLEQDSESSLEEIESLDGGINNTPLTKEIQVKRNPSQGGLPDPEIKDKKTKLGGPTTKITELSEIVN